MKPSFFPIALFTFLIFFMAGDILAQKNKNKPPIKSPESYTYKWHKIDSLSNLNQIITAQKYIEEIYNLAKQNNHQAELIKTIFYKIKLSQFEDDAEASTISWMENELLSLPFPANAILQNLLAKKYTLYLQQNYYQIIDRSVTETDNTTDFKTWDIIKFAEKISSLYAQSLIQADSLQKSPLYQFDSILKIESGSKILRPTLYDFLAHQAIDFLNESTIEISPVLSTFYLDNASFFMPAKQWADYAFATNDSTSFLFQSLRIYQKLLAFRLQQNNINALVDLDLKRLRWIYEKSIHPSKDSLYLKQLWDLESLYKSDTITSRTGLALARFYYEKAALFSADSDNKESHDLNIYLAKIKCDDIIKYYPETFAAQSAAILRNSIVANDLSLQTENTVSGEKNFLALVKYKMIPQLYFKVFKVDSSLLHQINDFNYQEEKIKFLLTTPLIKSWSQLLPRERNFTYQTAEIKIDALSFGTYFVVASNREDFHIDSAVLSYTKIQVSDLSYFSNTLENGDIEFWVLDRNSGQSISGATLLFFNNKDYSNPAILKNTLYQKITTNKEGYAILKAPNNRQSLWMKIQYKNDMLYGESPIYAKKNQTPFVANKNSYLFTDRSIYRPGQTLFFKAIVIEQLENNNQIVKNQAIKITLRNANYEIVKELTLVTDSMGSIKGNFILPSTGLTGSYTLSTDFNGYKTIQVEEYKRPKFEVLINPVSGSFKLNEIITISGKAQMYSGNVLTNAKIKYRVVRNVQYPYWRSYSGSYYPPHFSSSAQEIVSGVLQSDKTGNFSFSFTALPDPYISQKSQPVFSYTITIDATDISGETQSAEQIISVAYQSVQLQIEMKETLLKQNSADIKIVAKNWADENVNLPGVLKIYKLKGPQKLMRKKLWQHPGAFVMERETYEKNFPIDNYSGIENFKDWLKWTEMLTLNIDSSNSIFSLPDFKTWEEGVYEVEFKTNDIYGVPLNVQHFFTLIQPETKTMPYSSYAYFYHEEKNYAPGETADFYIGSSAKKVKIFYELKQGNQILERKSFEVNNEKLKWSVPIMPSYRGNISVHFAFIKDNRFYTFEKLIKVPFDNKKLSLSWKTFRDKTLPGQRESWQLNLKDHTGKPASAQLVASLYDASLDAILPHAWQFNVWRHKALYSSFTAHNDFSLAYGSRFHKNPPSLRGIRYHSEYDNFKWSASQVRDIYFLKNRSSTMLEKSAFSMTREDDNLNDGALPGANILPAPEAIVASEEIKLLTHSSPSPRKNLQETAFFFPNLLTDKEGSVFINFTIPEALTKWKLLGLAYTSDLSSILFEKEVVTQKELMIYPNAPRFLREGDKIIFTAKASNLSLHKINGKATLRLFDADTQQPVDSLFWHFNTSLPFEIEQDESTTIKWTLSVPSGLKAIRYIVEAASENFIDAEENYLPILSEQILVTETLPFWVKGDTSKSFQFESLLHASPAQRNNGKLTLEWTAQPAWYALQALPYLMEYPYECAEQVFNRFYANTIASYIASSSPSFKLMVDRWKSNNELQSKLYKNQTLKNILLEETPWVQEAETETEKQQRISLLFDINKMSSEQLLSIEKLKGMQLSNGGFPWFKDMNANLYITQYIVAGIGKLNTLKVIENKDENALLAIVKNALEYMDEKMLREFLWLQKEKNLAETSGFNSQIQYLYSRSFWNKKFPLSKKYEEAYSYFMKQTELHWSTQSLYIQGLSALVLYRADATNVVTKQILEGLKQTAIVQEEMGMYWKNNVPGYSWHQAPIETQALMIEVFGEIEKNTTSVDQLRIWLLKHKQTNAWNNTKSTADACYALLLYGSNWLNIAPNLNIKLGSQKINTTENGQAGSGYQKIVFEKSEIKNEMGNVQIEKTDKSIAWGALYFQYLESMNNVKPSSTSLKINKQLWLQTNTDKGQRLKPINKDTKLNIGDLIIVRIEIENDRAMDFVHLKDMRAAALEPLEMLSQAKWKNGLNFYQAPRDASVNFFFDHLPKGSFVFEYPLRISNLGVFNNGISTMQSMYAPEFSSQSSGFIISVE